MDVRFFSDVAAISIDTIVQKFNYDTLNVLKNTLLVQILKMLMSNVKKALMEVFFTNATV